MQRRLLQSRRPASPKLHAVCSRHLHQRQLVVVVHWVWPGHVQPDAWSRFVRSLSAVRRRPVRRQTCSDRLLSLQSWHQQSFQWIILTCSLCSLCRWHVLERERQQCMHALQCWHVQQPKRVILPGRLPVLPPRAFQRQERLNVVLAVRPNHFRPKPWFVPVQRVPCRLLLSSTILFGHTMSSGQQLPCRQ